MFFIKKEFHFSASHQLLDLPKSHPCARLHGHNYRVNLVLKAQNLNKYGFVRDFRDLDFFKIYLDEKIDHRHLNDVFSHSMVTSEFLAKQFFDCCQNKLPEIYRIEVSETSKSWAIYQEINSF